jgi:hypothetical protein
MKRTAMIVMTTGMILGFAAYAQGTQNLDSPNSEAAASQNHDTHCCKPDPSDMKGMQGMAEHTHDHAQATKKPAAKKPARTPAVREKNTEAK